MAAEGPQALTNVGRHLLFLHLSPQGDRLPVAAQEAPGGSAQSATPSA